MARLYENQSQNDDYSEDEIEEYYTSFYKREKHKKILISAVIIILFLGALFSAISPP